MLATDQLNRAAIGARSGTNSARRIGFLFNHDQIHQIAHSLPIALALAEQKCGLEVVIATTNPALRQEIERLAGPRIKHATMVALDTVSSLSRSLEHVLGKIIPARKLLIYRDNLEFFTSLDMLVVSERTSLLLKTRYGLERPTMVLADHGAGDRAIGFNPQTALFDHILAAGPKIRDRLIADAGVAADRISITGYPKFDAVPAIARTLPMQANGRPTVLYNPHPSPHLSSWYRMGSEVLEFFRKSNRYNLIFAPHVMLFQRNVAVTIDKLRIARTGTIDPRCYRAGHIHIDTGSVASTDMSYVQAADIYLGDVSSQIYEFLVRPRPCLFLNPHGRKWRGDPDYAHWQSGPVIEQINQLGEALEHAANLHKPVYQPVQQRLFDYTFSRENKPAADRAASKITELAQARV